MRVFFSNLGCKLNQAEVDQMARRFVAAGHELASGLGTADLHVVNSCTVTHLAARDSRKVARRGLRQGLRTVLTGCYATEAALEASTLGVDLVIPNDAKDTLLEQVHAAFPADVPPRAAGELPLPFVPLEVGHQRALVKVEDGCNMRCAFCIIPTTRGRQRSRPIAEVVTEAEALAGAGFPELVITGVQISEYEDGGRHLYDLMLALLAGTSARRLRLTSIAPWKFDDRLIEIYQHPRVCRHIHLSLQSGCTETLRRMRRPYSAPQYAALADRLRSRIPGLAVTTDVIVGFPGEDAREFESSVAFVEAMAFAKVHAFTFSPRAGTPAASLPDQVPPAVARERMHALLPVAQRGERLFWASQLGRRAQVVWDERRGERATGLTDNYVRVVAEAGAPAGALEEVELLAIEDGGVRAVRTALVAGRVRPALAVLGASRVSSS
jgi:threonylcarbamoyladenosine tRNA methylthiotransferase MtaB